MTVGLLSFAAAPAFNGGRAQVGLWFVDAFYDVWAIDALKQAAGITTTNASDATWPTLYDSDGYPTAMPNGGGATWVYSESYIYGNAGDVWVLDWTGSATIAMTGFSWPGTQGMTENIVSANRREYTLTGTPSGTISAYGNLPGGQMKVSVTISAVSGTVRPRLYRSTDETRINGTGATSIYTPEFLNRVKNFGVIRFMDWCNANGSRCQRSAYMPAESAASWGAGGARNAAWFYGVATVSGNRNTYTVPTTLPALTHGLPVQFAMQARPTSLPVVAITKGSPTSFRVPSHGLSTGDRMTAVLFADGGGSWTTAFNSKVVATGLPLDFPVTVTDANNFTVALDSSAFANPSTTTTISGLTSVSGTFSAGETVTGGTSGSTGTVSSFSGTTLVLSSASGFFALGETISGGVSGATAKPGTFSYSFSIFATISISDGTTTKRCVRAGLNNHTSSEWGGGAIYPRFVTATYDSTFDVFVISGDSVPFFVGFPLSAMLTLAKYCKAHPWFTLQYGAGDDMWTAYATQTKAALLGTALVPRFENGNEVWNTFTDTSYAQSIASKTYGTTGFGVTALDLGYAKRFNEVEALIEAVYGTGSNWQMILACQQGALNTNRLQGNSTINGGSSAGYPANKADRIATAPYTSPIFAGTSGNAVNYPGLLDQVDNYNQGGSSRNAAFAWMTAEMSTASTLGWRAFPQTLDDCIATVATQASTISGGGYTGRRGTGLPQTHYEGGPTQMQANRFSSAGFPANAPTSGRSVTYANLENFWLDWLGSTYAAQYIRSHMTRMAAAGIEFPAQYVIAGPWKTDFTTNQGLYNMNNVLSSAVPAFTELVNWNNGQ